MPGIDGQRFARAEEAIVRLEQTKEAIDKSMARAHQLVDDAKRLLKEPKKLTRKWRSPEKDFGKKDG